MLKIYGAKTFNAVKVVMTAEEAGLEYEYQNMDFKKGEHKAPEYLKLHPLGKIPAIEHNGHAIFESNNICRYLARIGENELYADAPLDAAKIDQMVDFIGYQIGYWVTVYFFQEIVKKTFRELDPNPDKVKQAGEMLKEFHAHADKLLGENEYLCGDRITIADTVAFAMFFVSEYTTYDFSEFSNLCRWYNQIKARPSFDVVMEKIPNGYDFG